MREVESRITLNREGGDPQLIIFIALIERWNNLALFKLLRIYSNLMQTNFPYF